MYLTAFPIVMFVCSRTSAASGKAALQHAATRQTLGLTYIILFFFFSCHCREASEAEPPVTPQGFISPGHGLMKRPCSDGCKAMVGDLKYTWKAAHTHQVLFVDTLKSFFPPVILKTLKSSALWKPKLNCFHNHYRHQPHIKMKKNPLKLEAVK